MSLFDILFGPKKPINKNDETKEDGTELYNDYEEPEDDDPYFEDDNEELEDNE